MTYTKITGSPCGDPTCYRGGVGGWNYQYKDGPCASPACQWPWQVLINPGPPQVWVRATTEREAVTYGTTYCHGYRRLPPRPHFTDTPALPIIDAGKCAWGERHTMYSLDRTDEDLP